MNGVTITFQQPDFNERRNPNTRGAWDQGVELSATGFDLDFNTLTIYDETVDINRTLAVRAEYMNEDGYECGMIGWKIEPEPDLLSAMPELAEHVGKRYGRVLVFAQPESDRLAELRGEA